MNKTSLLITTINHDTDNAEQNDMLREKYGYVDFAILQGNGGLNTKIALIKLLRAVTGAELKPAKQVADDIVALINGLGSAETLRADIVDQVSKMDGAQLRSLQRHISSAFGNYADHTPPKKFIDHFGLDEYANPANKPF